MTSDDMTVLRIGTLIENNHGYVLEMKPGVLPFTTVVLCFLPHNKLHPFVIHSYMEDSGICHTGEYCDTLSHAQQRFGMRVA